MVTFLLVLRYRLRLNLEEIHRRACIEDAVVVDVAPACRAILNLAILLGVVIHIVANHIVPIVDARYRCLVVEQPLCWVY